jgi:glycosyltransferase involved in cell wall biosynthesis
MLEHITPLIITFNEAPNIRRTIDKLLWSQRIVVVDSGSTDQTIEIVRSYRQVEIIHHRFESFADQCNFGLRQITSPWVLSLDADYELSDELVEELKEISLSEQISGYRARFVYRIHGKPLRGTLYPARLVLYRPSLGTYRNEGHGHRVTVEGELRELKGVIYHDDRKPLARWLTSQKTYAAQEANYLMQSSRDTLTVTDRIRLMGWLAPIGVFFYALFVRGCILDGWAGWYYVLQRVVAEMLIAMELADRRLRHE